MSVENYIKARAVHIKNREQKVFSSDRGKIADFLTKNNINALQDTSGLQYIVHNKSGGKKPALNDCVEVKYTGKFLETGKVFDKSERIAFPLSNVIPGWRLGIPLLGIGDSATLFIPSKLGYGPQGYAGAIPRDAILIFDVTLLDIKSQYDQATRTCK
jgi:FKBP-type peptidyl-prolyl cis-trans isomerase FkpA/FKBP-type peptidyl-prolyl cis-trans isomerase FklB